MTTILCFHSLSYLLSTSFALQHPLDHELQPILLDIIKRNDIGMGEINVEGNIEVMQHEDKCTMQSLKTHHKFSQGKRTNQEMMKH